MPDHPGNHKTPRFGRMTPSSECWTDMAQHHLLPAQGPSLRRISLSEAGAERPRPAAETKRRQMVEKCILDKRYVCVGKTFSSVLGWKLGKSSLSKGPDR